MNKFLCILLAAMIFCSSVLAVGEETESKQQTCQCCECQANQGNSDSRSKQIDTGDMTPEESYRLWLEMSWTILYARYADATWFRSMSYYKDGSHYLPQSFMLLDDILTLSEDDINNIGLCVNGDEDDLKRYVRTYSFIKNTPSSIESIISTRSLFNDSVPSGYEAIDNLMMNAANGLLDWHNSIVEYMNENSGILEGFATAIPEKTKDNIEKLRYVFAFLDN